VDLVDVMDLVDLCLGANRPNAKASPSFARNKYLEVVHEVHEVHSWITGERQPPILGGVAVTRVSGWAAHWSCGRRPFGPPTLGPT